MKIKAKDFYIACEEAGRLEKLHLSANKRPLILAQTITDMCNRLAEGTEVDMSLKGKYLPEWFAYAWQAKKQEVEDAEVLHRFSEWFLAKLKSSECYVKSNIICSVQHKDIVLEQVVDLLVRKTDGSAHAYIVEWRNHRFSPKGRSIHTKIDNAIQLRVAKEYLEPDYPGIEVSLISLMRTDDRNGSIKPQFSEETARKNLLTPKWESYYSEQGFLMDDFVKDTDKIIEEPVQKKCSDCLVKEFCCVPKCGEIVLASGNEHSENMKVAEKSYSLPEFSEEQKKAVNTLDGPVIVVAGPGSGKTAVLTGRVLALKKRGACMKRVLLISFAREAAKEISSRVMPYMDEDDKPVISTLNALGYDILRQSEKITGRKCRLARETDFKVLLKSILGLCNPIPGISYAAGNAYERHGLYDNVYSKIVEYTSSPQEDKSLFFEKYPDIGKKEFLSVVDMFISAKNQKGFISYDEQISLALETLKEYPDILKQYQKFYTYIMVDEFQDVSREQAEFIYLLADKHRNLCVVGDDDQEIYGFRGSTNECMLEFAEKFNAKTIILSDNYRSGSSIVRTSQSVIHANPEKRIEKPISGVRYDVNKPLLYPNADEATLDSVISECMAAGYKYSDIAILSIRNAPLEDLAKKMKVPVLLNKARLIDDFAFVLAHQFLALDIYGLSDSEFYKTVKMLSENQASTIHRKNSHLSLYEDVREQYGLRDVRTDAEYYLENIDMYREDSMPTVFAKIAVGLQLVEQLEPEELMPQLARIFGVDGSVVSEMVAELCVSGNIHSMATLYSCIHNMIMFRDDTRIRYQQQTDAVTLMTSHDAKGKEFPCVIIWGVDEFTDSPESVRLLYVAMTRAEDRLYLLKKGISKGCLLESLGDSIEIIEKGGN